MPQTIELNLAGVTCEYCVGVAVNAVEEVPGLTQLRTRVAWAPAGTERLLSHARRRSLDRVIRAADDDLVALWLPGSATRHHD